MATGRRGLRQLKKERTRRRLIESATALFERKGYQNTTLSEIAAGADVSRGTIFSYFSSKEDLLFSGTDSRLRIALQAIADGGPGDRPVDALRRAVRAAMRDLMAESETMALLRVRLVLRDRGLQRVAFQRVFGIQRSIASQLHETFADELDAMSAAAMVGALIGGLLAALVEFVDDPEQLEKALTEDAAEMWHRVQDAVTTAVDELARTR